MGQSPESARTKSAAIGSAPKDLRASGDRTLKLQKSRDFHATRQTPFAG
jgi:hypothetical protein